MIGSVDSQNSGLGQLFFQKSFPEKKEEELRAELSQKTEKKAQSGEDAKMDTSETDDFEQVVQGMLRQQGNALARDADEQAATAYSRGPRGNDFWQLQLR